MINDIVIQLYGESEAETEAWTLQIGQRSRRQMNV